MAKRSPEARRYQRLYKSKRWKDLRLKVFERDKYICQRTGELCSGTYPEPNSPTANHIVPHKGDERLFYDPDNLETVTKSWHDRQTQSQERGGTKHLQGCDVYGWPLSGEHEWNAR